ncbi:MAG: OsmC family protein [Gloeobacteraceae cyanobacterium ES-bin-316]|nr:OsmC family protein [Ferruginibacter sp.]
MHIKAGTHFMLADEPLENGGEGTAPDPYEFLSASLSTCTLATLQLYLKRKDWNIKLLSVDVSFTDEDKAGVKTAHFFKTIRVTGTMDETQRNRLLLISDACPVSKILKSGSNTIDTVITN